MICTEKGMIIRTINTLWVDHAHVKSRVADPDPYLINDRIRNKDHALFTYAGSRIVDPN